MFIILIVLVFVLLYFYRQGDPYTRYSNPGNNAIETLRERYARGDISEQEFRERKRFLDNY